MKGMEKKKPMGTGRKKIQIKKIEKKTNLQVTFSKRRTGLFNKAAQLSAICGAEVAVIVMSPANRFYAFGNPSADSVIDRFLAINSSPFKPKMPSLPPLSLDHHVLLSELETEKERRKAAEESKEVSGGGFWWDEPIDELGLDELEQYRASLEVLKKKVTSRLDKIWAMDMATATAMASTSSSSFLAPAATSIPMDEIGIDFDFDF